MCLLLINKEGDGGEEFPVPGVEPEPDPAYEPPRDIHDPELEEPIEEYVEDVPQNYDVVMVDDEKEK